MSTSIINVKLSWVSILLPVWRSIFILLFSCNVIYGQSNNVDSLRTRLSNTTTNTERLDLLNELSRALANSDLDKSLMYSRKALSLSRQINDREKEARAMFSLGLLLFETPAIDSSLIYFEASEQLADDMNLGSLQSDNLMRLANWYRYHTEDSIKTVSYLLESVEVSKAADYHYGTGRSYAKLASFYTRYKRVDLCEENLKLAAQYYLKKSNGKKDIAHYYNEVGDKIWEYNPKRSMDFYFEGLNYSTDYPNLKVSLGKAYSTIGAPDKALKYLNEAVYHLDSTGKDRVLGIALAQLAKVQIQLGDHKKAFETCEETISRLEPLGIGMQSSLPAIYRIKGQLMELNGNDRSALEYYTQSLDKANEINKMLSPVKMIPKTVESNIVLGNYWSSRSPERGENYCKIALENAKINHYTNFEIDACECLYNILKAEEKYSEALKYYERKEILDDSLSTLQVEHALVLAQKDNQLAEEAHQKEIKEEQLKNQKRLKTIFAVSSLLGFLLIVFLVGSRKRISDQNSEIISKTNELEEANLSLARSNEDLERFAHVASHDLKSPLNTIINFSDLIIKTLDKEGNPKVKEYMSFVQSSGKRMHQLIGDILEFSKLSNENSDGNELEIIDLNAVVNEISQLVMNNPQGKIVSIEADDLPNLKWNYSKIFLLFKNFIENGVKYNESDKPSVKLSYSNSGTSHMIAIEDNGIGIKEEHFDKIFEMFQRLHGHGQYEGTGLGLATCKKITDEFKGQISISSEIDSGTIFKMQIPSKLIASKKKAFQEV